MICIGAIDQIIYGYERGDRGMLTKGVSELLQTQAGMFVFNEAML